MNREQWLKDRKKGIGGSDAAAVLGLNPYSSALAVYLDKIGEGEPVEENERMGWGLKLEKLIVAEYETRTGMRVVHNTEQSISIHPVHDWMCCTLDAVAYPLDDPKNGGVLQAKNVDRFMKHEWEDRVPEHYLIQLMHEIAVTGLKWGALVVLIGGNEWRSYEFDRDEDLISLIIEKESAFWHENVLKRIPPDPTGASLEVLGRMYKQDNGKSITLYDDAIGKAITSYLDAKAHLDRYTKQKEDSEAIIKSAMGDAAQGIYQAGDTMFGISWSSVKGRVGFDAKTFEQENPELYKKYVKTGASYRRFMVKEKKAAIGQTKLKEVA
ncbi:MAG TPA: YqaJ viral recombinase family protein [Deltaproteobacteria bacterium]|nr:YqaJ viral recombinase family protein [Deltaproteobacteria bacterium]